MMNEEYQEMGGAGAHWISPEWARLQTFKELTKLIGTARSFGVPAESKSALFQLWLKQYEALGGEKTKGIPVGDGGEDVAKRVRNRNASTPARILAVLEEETTAPNIQDLFEKLPDIKRGTLRTNISRLIHNGKIQQTPSGRFRLGD